MAFDLHHLLHDVPDVAWFQYHLDGGLAVSGQGKYTVISITHFLLYNNNLMICFKTNFVV